VGNGRGLRRQGIKALRPQGMNYEEGTRPNED